VGLLGALFAFLSKWIERRADRGFWPNHSSPSPRSGWHNIARSSLSSPCGIQLACGRFPSATAVCNSSISCDTAWGSSSQGILASAPPLFGRLWETVWSCTVDRLCSSNRACLCSYWLPGWSCEPGTRNKLISPYLFYCLGSAIRLRSRASIAPTAWCPTHRKLPTQMPLLLSRPGTWLWRCLKSIVSKVAKFLKKCFGHYSVHWLTSL